ncbi:hypothetical protein [Candidatus Poriferisodalis sp.]|uniref:hypothetical protein n=1 Tax=Candidatus Poriferisodalis sp. TaxID=3101277 RepID=UPI003B51591D
MPTWEEYQVRVGTDTVTYYDSFGRPSSVEEVPRYETRRRISWTSDCETIQHSMREEYKICVTNMPYNMGPYGNDAYIIACTFAFPQ